MITITKCADFGCAVTSAPWTRRTGEYDDLVDATQRWCAGGSGRLCLKPADRYTDRMRYLIAALLALPGIAAAHQWP